MPVEEYERHWGGDEPYVTKTLNPDGISYRMEIDWTVESFTNCFSDTEIFEVIDNFLMKETEPTDFWFDTEDPEIKALFGRYYLNSN